jgi:hypothetical protein
MGGQLVVNVINPCEAGVVIDYPPAVCGRYTMGLQIHRGVDPTTEWAIGYVPRILLPNGPVDRCLDPTSQ